MKNSFQASLMPNSLRCEFQVNPTQLDVLVPRLSWINRPLVSKNGLVQTAYEIEVASSEVLLNEGSADIWSSGKIISNESHLVPYGGSALLSGATYWWRVRTWDGDDAVSSWSDAARWTMGMLESSDWRCKWIGAPWQGEEPSKYSGEWPAAPLLRKTFSIDRPIKSACFFGTGLGYFELYINGVKANDHLLSPNQTNYGKRPGIEGGRAIPLADNFEEYRVFYVGIDLTQNVRDGLNAVGAILGNGFYNTDCHWDEPYGSPRFFGQVILEYVDGTREYIVSDESWLVAKSPIVENDIFRGEHYDARLEQDGWCIADFDDSQWEHAILREAPFGHLVAQNGPHDCLFESFAPISILEEDGAYRVRFPVEISGWVHLKGISAPRGNCISIKYICESPIGANSYTCKGLGNESYHARFSWYVFSEVVITGWYGKLSADNIVAEAINSNVPCIATFKSSNELFNKLQDAFVRTQLDNMHGSIASDCPHRERTPYTGDGALCIPMVVNSFDASAFYNKWIQDVRGAANKDTGHVPNSAPWQPGAGGGVAWGAAIAIMPWYFYETYGDVRILADNLDAMLGYIRYLDGWATDDIVEKNDPTSEWQNLGDWIPAAKEIPHNIVHTWYYWKCVDIARRSALIVGRKADAEYLTGREQSIRTAFQRYFYDEELGSYGPYGANVFALAMGVPEEQRQRVIAALEKNIADAGGHTDGGMIATTLLFSILSENGRTELAYDVMNKDDIPSMGYWIKSGSTTLWEYWNGAHSHNHPIHGSGFTWFFHHVAGLAPDWQRPGYRNIIINPKFPSKLSNASCSIETVYGTASVAWERRDGKISLDIVVPVGATAEVRVAEIACTVGQGSYHYEI